MKNRCVKKPFDFMSWCNKDTRTEFLSYTLDGLLLVILNNRKNGICPKCVTEIKLRLDSV